MLGGGRWSSGPFGYLQIKPSPVQRSLFWRFEAKKPALTSTLTRYQRQRNLFRWF